jgi:hypothetical protein
MGKTLVSHHLTPAAGCWDQSYKGGTQGPNKFFDDRFMRRVAI